MGKTIVLKTETWLRMMRQGAARLNASRKEVNNLNVFPIPDGDTGDNMYMTVSSGLSSARGTTLGELAGNISKGMLFGARGNSGVILSRIFAGISKGLEGLESSSVKEFSEALRSGVEESYKAVSTPVEGTLLTVFREGSEAVAKTDPQSLEDLFEILLAEMEASLKRTPDLLPVLKEAGVIDSGGAGLICIFRGIQDALLGNETESAESSPSAAAPVNFDDFGPDTELLYGYCTEFLLRLQTSKVGDVESFDGNVIKNWLESAGESVVCFKDGSIVKAHVHTTDPGAILSLARQWGEFLTVKIENMTLQHSETTIQDNFSGKKDSFARARKKYGAVAVASGKGLCAAMREAGADVVVEGGQTMNPSAGCFVEAFGKVDAEDIFVFPNNSNIIMAARQAAELYTASRIHVIPSKNVGTGYVALASMDRSAGSAGEIIEACEAVLGTVETGMITTAIRDSSLDGVDMHEGEFIGICDGKIVAASDSKIELARMLAAKMDFASHDVALCFTGEGVPAEESGRLVSNLQELYPRTEIMPSDGGQPVYNYIIVLC